GARRSPGARYSARARWSPGARSVADAVVADVAAAVEREVTLRDDAQVDDDPWRLAVDDAGDPRHVRVHDGARVGAGPHEVARVVGVDHVAPVTGVDDRRLRVRPAGVIVAPDHVAAIAADDRVTAIAAEQPVG